MAETIQENISVTVGVDVLMRGYFSATGAQTGSENFSGTQSIATTSTAIELGAVSTIGGLFVRNEDATNYVEVDGVTTFDSAMKQKLLPGKACYLRPGTVTLYAKANTGACIIRVVAVEL